MFGVELLATGEDDGGGFKEGTVPGERGFGLDVELASGGDGAAREGGDGGFLAGEGEGDIADDAGGGAEVAARKDEAIRGRGFDDEELLASARLEGEGAGDSGGIAIVDGDADCGGGGGLLRGGWGGGGEGVRAGVLWGLGEGERKEDGHEGCRKNEGGAHSSLFDADGGVLWRDFFVVDDERSVCEDQSPTEAPAFIARNSGDLAHGATVRSG